MAVLASSESFALDRLIIGSLGHHLAVFPSKMCFGMCSVLSTCAPTFLPTETFVIVEGQFLLLARLLADFCASFESDFKTYKEKKSSEVDFSNSFQPKQKVLQVANNNGLSLTIKSHNLETKLCKEKLNINSAKALQDFIDSFLQLVLKAYCYPPLAIKALLSCLEHIQLQQYQNLTESFLLKCFETFPTYCVDYYYLSELILRHKDLLYQMKRLQSFCNKKVATTGSGSTSPASTTSGTTLFINSSLTLLESVRF